MTAVRKITTKGSFLNGRFVPAGFPVRVDSSKLSGRERNLIDAPAGLKEPATVEMSAIAPTGPNPTGPQQVPPDAIQTIEGHVLPGATLVGERTQPEADRFAGDGDAGAQAQIAEALMDDSGKSDPLDHDEDGKKGGSKSGAESTSARGAAKKA